MSKLYAQDDIKKLVSPVLQRYPNITTAYLFGSYSRGQATEASDIDLAVTIDAGIPFSLIDMAGLIIALEKATKKKVDILDDYQIEQLKKKNPRFFKRFEQDKELIYVK